MLNGIVMFTIPVDATHKDGRKEKHTFYRRGFHIQHVLPMVISAARKKWPEEDWNIVVHAG